MADGDPVDPGNQDPAPNPDPPAGDPPVGDPGPKAFVFDDAMFNTLPDDLKSEPSVQIFKGKPLPDILKSHVHAQRLVGADKVAIPTGKFDTPEAWNALYAKLGRPETPDGYQFDAVALPEGVNRNPDIENAFKGISHKLGLTPKQATELYAAYNGMAAEAQKVQIEGQAKAIKDAEADLRAEWGNKYDERLALATKVIDTYGGKAEQVTEFKEKFGNDPTAIRILANLGNLVSEGNFVTGDRPAFLSTPQEAEKKARDIMVNPQNPLHDAYHNRSNFRHNEAVEEVERLFVVAKGSKAVDAR